VIPISDIYHLIDRLERLFNESWQVPLSTYLVVNEEDCLDVVDQMRTAIPQEIRQGERIQQERERIIAQAEEEADRIVQLARDRASGLVDEHDLIQAANQRADTIIERAQREAEQLKSEADEYARQVLIALNEQIGALDGQIEALLKIVQNGLVTLSGEEPPEPDPEAV
jgi:cell division septum initiation protein DivIVA